MKIVFPEYQNPIIQSAIHFYQTANPDFEAIESDNLETACLAVKNGEVEAMIAGIDYSSREVILACREHFGMGTYPPEVSSHLKAGYGSETPMLDLGGLADRKNERYSTFSGLAVMQQPNDSKKSSSPAKTHLLADMAACKHPSREQLIEITLQTYHSAQKILSEPPRIALLSFSTFGSGGHDETITLLQDVKNTIQSFGIDCIDGEMQLDAAINPRVAQKKSPNSPVAGQANVLIAPDLNSGNLLYKAFEQIAGYTVAGPILQGFAFPVSDLSRGSNQEDVILTLDALSKLVDQSS